MIIRIKKRVWALLVVISLSVAFLVLPYFAFGVTNCWDYKSNLNCTANTRCNWRDDAWGSGWCEELGCWSYYTESGCLQANSTGVLNGTCLWQGSRTTTSSWCTEVSCWNYEGTNQTACETDTDAYGLDCTWGPSDSSTNGTAFNCFGGPQCYGVNISNNEPKCRNTTGCKWGSCWEKGCWSYTSQATCNADTDCYWSNYNYCTQVGCWDTKHNTQSSCTNTSDTLSCRWNSQYNYCEELNCWSFSYNQTGCQNTGVAGLVCNWNNPWCETKSCWQNNDESSCRGKTGYSNKNCTWQVSTYTTTGWCETAGCWSFDEWHGGNQSACENNGFGLSCAWQNFTWGGSCFQNFTSVLSCANITDEKKCYDSMWCWWDSSSNKTNKCNEPSSGSEGGAVGGGSFMAPGCWIFDSNISSCTNTTGCTYDSTTKTCNVNSNAEVAAGIQSNGLNCTLLNTTNLCNSATFLPRCCEWQASGCVENKYTTSCWDNLKKPPEGATYCEDYNVLSSEAKCNEISNHPWYMPCRWNNATKHCEFKDEQVFTQGEEGDIDLVDNRDLCEKGVGGIWLTESYCGSGNMTNSSITIGRCAQKVGSQGGNCDSACFRCEFKADGSNHSGEGAARTTCEESALGFCTWRPDTNAPNRLGFCEPSSEIKGGVVGKCDSNNCEACNSYNTLNAKTKCQEAKCEWKVDPLDTTKGFCASTGTTTCLDRCESCNDQVSCVEKGRGVNGSCTWDVSFGFCKKTSTADNTGAAETCFDGVDNDGDAKIDCADGGCFSDPFCGGTSIKDCWQYSNNVSCVDNGCRWFNDTYGSWCDQQGAVCWQYDGNAAGCIQQQNVCQWQPAAAGSVMCNMNESVWDECSPLTQNQCNTNSRCYWFVDQYMGSIGGSRGWCGHRHEVCYFNQTLMSSQTACLLANETIGGNISCNWRFDPWSPNGGFCESRCFSLGNDCNTFGPTAGMCNSKDGWCNPAGFGGNGSQVFNCFQYDIQSTCINQTNCKWFPDPKATCDVSRSTDCFNFKTQVSCNGNINCSWSGFDANSGWCDQKVNRCRWNFTLSTSQAECNLDPLCYWKNWSGVTSGPGPAPIGSSDYASCEPKATNATTETQCLNLNGTWRNGWCESAAMVTSFAGMDMESPPIPLGSDPCQPEVGLSPFVDICYFGMKDSKDNFGLGTGVNNIKDAAMCNGVSTWQGIGSGNNTVRFYWYVDSDGKSSSGCTLYSNSSSAGWDLHFRYEASYANGSVKESKKAERCISGEWKTSNIKVNAWKEKMCNEIQGGMVSVNKDDLKAISGLLNLSSTLRFYTATANETGNVSSPADTVGPSYFTPGSIDFISECCWAVGDASTDCDGDGLNPGNDPDCALLMYKGFIPFEDCFGNSIDEDADLLTDCNDPDCKGNPYCVQNQLGVESPTYVDSISPKIIYWNVEKYPDAVLLSFDTDESANGTVDFYYNSSSCLILNKTLYDVGIYNNNTQKYKNWHEVEIYNDTGINSLNYTLSGNKTYFYKLKVCDTIGNCAQSACSNFTTAISSARCKKCSFIVDMTLPSGWLLDIDLDVDGNYETALHRQCGASSGILLNYTTARNVNLRFRENSSNTTLFFLDARLTRSLSHNEKIRDVGASGGIKSGTTSTTAGTTVGYTGLSKEISNKLVDKLHPKSCMIQVDKGTGTTCSALYHCDDNLANCVRRDTAAGVSLNETGPNYCIWKMPCIFSTYAGGSPGTSSSSSSSSSSSGGGGGGGGGGGAAAQASANTEASASRRWDALTAGTSPTLKVNNEKIAITEVVIYVQKTVSNVDLIVGSLKSNPLPTQPSAKIYQYLELSKSNIADADTSKITINFKVSQSWLASNNIAEDNVVLYRYSESKWNELPTAKILSDVSNVFYQAVTPGFSTFAVGGKETAPVLLPTANETITQENISAPVEETIEIKPEQIPPTSELRKPSRETLNTMLIVSGIILFVLITGYFVWKKVIYKE